MPTFTNDPVFSKTTSKNAISVLGESEKNEGVRGVSHNEHAGVVGINDWSPATPPGAGGNGGWFESTQGEGVRGWAKTPHHAGVIGVNTAGGIGVFGQSNTQTAVVGESDTGNGGTFESNRGEGVRGVSKNPDHGGVVGVNTGNGIAVFGTSAGEGVHGESTAGGWVAGVTGLAANANGVGPGVLGQANGSGPGVFGRANRDAGVVGFHGDPHLEETLARQDGATAGVFGASDVGAGIVGYSRSADAAKFVGNVQVTGNLTVHGDIFVPGADCAEQFDIADAQQVEPGSVLVIDRDGTLRESQASYDTKVAGVVSGAGTYKPGIVLDKQQAQNNRLPVALVGKVYCKVDAQYSPISVGDLLTTSPTSGHAMKASDPLKAFGAVIGKALGNLPAGRGLLPILVCLQ